MPRPKGNEGQRLDTYKMYNCKFGPTAIHKQLKTRFDAGEYGDYESLVHLNTVKNWLREFREADTGLDNCFEWRQMDLYGLPWEASSFLLPMWSWLKEGGPLPTKGFRFPSPSVRQIRWWWRIHLVDPELGHKWVWTIAQWFVVREALHDALGKPLDLADLEAYLSYRPWRRGNLETYLQAVDAGRIPAIKPTPGWSDDGEWLYAFPLDESLEYPALPWGIAVGYTGNPESLLPAEDQQESEDSQ